MVDRKKQIECREEKYVSERNLASDAVLDWRMQVVLQKDTRLVCWGSEDEYMDGADIGLHNYYIKEQQTSLFSEF